MRTPTLYVFSGLPGVGKTTLARGLCHANGYTYLRIDTLEQGLRTLTGLPVEVEGYRLSQRIAADNLNLGTSVVADCVNPISLSRHEWMDVAQRTHTTCVCIEVVCTDLDEHRYRIEQRSADIEGLQLPTWDDVQHRNYEPWSTDVVRIDTAGRTPEDALQQMLDRLQRNGLFDP